MEDLLLPWYLPDIWKSHPNSSGDVKPPQPCLDSWHDAQLALGASTASESVLWKARRSHALTLAHGLQQLPALHALDGKNGGRGRGREGRWLLWIVGAREEVEGELARQGLLVEVLDRTCPREAGWELLLVGPEMRCWEMDARAGRGLLRARNGPLHMLCAEGQGETPNAAVLFNSGIGTLLWPLVEQWLPTVVRLLQMDMPLLCTCFNICERDGERAVLERTLGATPLTEPRRNPFGHPTPIAALARGCDERVAEAQVRQCVASIEAWERMREVERRADDEASDSKPSATDLEAHRVWASQETSPNPVSNRWFKWLRGPLPGEEDELLHEARRLVRECTKATAPLRMKVWVAELASMIDDAGQVAVIAMLIAEAVNAEAGGEASISLLARSCGAEAVLHQAYKKWAPKATTRLLNEPEEARPAPPDGERSYTGRAAADEAAAACITALRRISASIAAMQRRPLQAGRLS